MLKSALALALPAVVLGIGLAQTTPADRAGYLAVLQTWMSGAPPLQRAALDNSAGLKQPVTATQQVFARGMTTLDPDRFGQFETSMEIAGRTLPALVDTGATFVTLSYEDAASIGIHPANQAFTAVMRTANGTTKVALIMIPHVKVGNVEAYDVQAVVSAPGALGLHNLLGMSFLKKLAGFQVDGGRLVLRQ